MNLESWPLCACQNSLASQGLATQPREQDPGLKKLSTAMTQWKAKYVIGTLCIPLLERVIIVQNLKKRAKVSLC